MRQYLRIFIGLQTIFFLESVIIEYPTSKSIEERQRTDLNTIDSIFRSYITPREIQFQSITIKDDLAYFLRCKGSKNSLEFIIPPSANNYVSIEKDDRTHTITLRLSQKRLHADLIGRYTCSEKVNQKIQQTAIYVFIPNERSVFTKKIYPKIFKETGIHFFNIPCQTTSWHAKNSCTQSSSSKRDPNACIPVSYAPSNLKAEKIFFDPQIGFALVNPTISDQLNEFTCSASGTSNEQSTVPYDRSQPAFVQIHQQGFTVMQDEVVQLTCEIQYTARVYQKEPRVFWFEDIYDLRLMSNQSKPRIFNDQTKLFHQNATLILQGFKPTQIYRFYCVRESDGRLYSRSVDVTGAKDPSVDLTVDLSSTDTNNEIAYGSNAVYDLHVLTVPHSEIQISLLRDGISFPPERFKLSLINNQEERLWDYTLTIYNMTFEDEADLQITAKASIAEKSVKIKPSITGQPVGEFSFIPEQIPHAIPWRYEQSKIYTYGILERESYRVVCNVRHRSDSKRSLNVFIQYHQCAVENCLVDLAGKKCQSSTNQNTLSVTPHRTAKFQIEFVSKNAHRLDNPSTGYQYLCCYEQNGFVSIAQAITVLSHNRTMFTVAKPEYGLVTGDILTYRCQGHSLLYNDLQMIYKDGLLTYERNRLDKAWRLQGSRERSPLDINWNVPISKDIRSMAIEVKTPALTKNRNQAYFQCTAKSKRTDLIPNGIDTYVIYVEDQIPLEFKKSMDSVVNINRRAGDPIELDCSFNGRPKPKILWMKGKSLLNISELTFLFENNKTSLRTHRAQAIDTGYYTCLVNNGRGKVLERHFNLRVEGTNPQSKFGRVIGPIIIVSVLLLLIMLITLIFFAVKYCRMITGIHKGVYYENKPTGQEDQNQPAVTQLAHIPLPANFASKSQIETFLDYVNGKVTPANPEDFKELGRGQFGVVYQVRLPDIGLVAAKILPEAIRQTSKHSRERRKKSAEDLDESQEMLDASEVRKKKAVEMLIDEIKVMNRAGKHVNIVALKKVAYPRAEFRMIVTGGMITEGDSFYVMELCANGSLESMLKRFLQFRSGAKYSLYELLSNRPNSTLTIDEAHEQCRLSDDDLILIAYQVAWGIDYLNRRQIAHCDVAPRNVLVTSRFIMKICDFGLATWTTYKNYREQLAENNSVQLEKKNNEIATHNLTPELARAFLRASNPDERLLLNKSSITSDVWSFGIFLWTLFLKCRIRPFNKLLKEMERTPSSESFFHRLARIISDGRVLKYIDYQPEIPRNIYGIICECLVEEDRRPVMTRIRGYLCHSNTLSKRAFDYYRSEYDQYQEENAVDSNIERFPEVQGVRDLPTFDSEYNSLENAPPVVDSRVTFRPPTNSDLYYEDMEEENPHAPPPIPSRASRATTEIKPPPPPPQTQTKRPAPIKPPKKPDTSDDPYV